MKAIKNLTAVLIAIISIMICTIPYILGLLFSMIKCSFGKGKDDEEILQKWVEKNM